MLSGDRPAARFRWRPAAHIGEVLGGDLEISTVAVPLDCTDGFTEAFYGRPERFLDPEVRAAQSAWGFVDDQAVTRAVETLRRDLEDGTWDQQYGHLRDQQRFDGALRLITCRP